jgi:hypothetical protein
MRERELGEASYGNRRERANERGEDLSPARKKKRKEKGKRGNVGEREKEREGEKKEMKEKKGSEIRFFDFEVGLDFL